MPALALAAHGSGAETSALFFLYGLGAPEAPFRRRCELLFSRVHTLPKCGLEIGWPTVLAEEIGEGFVGEFREVVTPCRGAVYRHFARP
jgi:hypothetical protein